MKKYSGFIIFLSILLFLLPAYADILILQNGNTVEGKITEQTDKYTKIESEGVSLTYYPDEIKSINNLGVANNPAKSSGIKVGKWSITWATQTHGLPPEAVSAMNSLSPEMKQMMEDKMKVEMQKHGMNLQSFDLQGDMTVTMTQCVTEQTPFPFFKTMSSLSCKETHEINGNTVHFHKTCDTKMGAVDEDGNLTYNGDSMQGDENGQVNMMGQSMGSTTHFTGKYLGSCS